MAFHLIDNREKDQRYIYNFSYIYITKILYVSLIK